MDGEIDSVFHERLLGEISATLRKNQEAASA
jgi:hypothetical protein